MNLFWWRKKTPEVLVRWPGRPDILAIGEAGLWGDGGYRLTGWWMDGRTTPWKAREEFGDGETRLHGWTGEELKKIAEDWRSL